MKSESREALKKHNISIIHTGISFDSREDSYKAAELFSDMLAKEITEIKDVSYFVGEDIELLNRRNRGAYGHIGFATDDLPATLAILEAEGYAVNTDTARYSPDGRLKLVYLRDEYWGFMIHFTQRKL